MKTLLFLFSVLMIGCGGAPGNNETLPIPIGEDPGIDDPTTPGITCKSFNDVWESDLDQERHDFRGLTPNVGYYYTYTGPLGEPCGDAPNGYHSITLTYQQGTSHPSHAGFDGTITWRYKEAIFPGCGQFHGGGVGKHTFATYKVQCDKLTLCGNDGSGNFNVCKTFH